jgi:signal transduction histidine kinase
MSAPGATLDALCTDALREHLQSANEGTLHAAYELGRRALDERMGLVDLASMIHRALGCVVLEPGAPRLSPSVLERFEAFALEFFSPFEMEYRGAREASRALRRMNERGEEHVRRIAYELHDSAGQLLATVHFALDAAARQLGAPAHAALAPVRTRLEEVEVELRRLSHELRPTLLDHLGLVPALRELARGVSARSGIGVVVVDGAVGRLPPPVETALYRVAQEALTNAVRHARATQVDLRLSLRPGAVHCVVSDNGVGFDPAAIDASTGAQGLGLAGMAERLAPLSGSLRIDSSPGRGVKLDIHIPLEAFRANANTAGR